MNGFSDIVTLPNATDIMTLECTLVHGVILEVRTIQGQRSIKLNGVDRMSLLTSGPNWLQLKQQGNVLKSYGEASGDGKAVITSYSYRAAWWGI
jgi:hypothetical protein